MCGFQRFRANGLGQMQTSIACPPFVLSLHQFAESLGQAVDAKDPWTFAHSEEVADIARLLARKLGFSPDQAEMVHMAGHLHDIGKIGIPDRILQKPGPLTKEEFEVIKQHPVIGEGIVGPVKALNGRSGLARMIRHHHERFDGKGYPDGLIGDSIPFGARILAVADSLSAMMQDRPYKRAMDFGAAESEIMENTGSMYDPAVVAAFLRIAEKIRGVLERNRARMQLVG